MKKNILSLLLILLFACLVSIDSAFARLGRFGGGRKSFGGHSFKTKKSKITQPKLQKKTHNKLEHSIVKIVKIKPKTEKKIAKAPKKIKKSRDQKKSAKQRAKKKEKKLAKKTRQTKQTTDSAQSLLLLHGLQPGQTRSSMGQTDQTADAIPVAPEATAPGETLASLEPPPTAVTTPVIATPIVEILSDMPQPTA